MTAKPRSPRVTIPGNRKLRARIMEKFHKSIGQELFLTDLAQELGADETAIRSSISNLIRTEPDYPLLVCVRGRSWRYLPNGSEPEKGTPKSLKSKPAKRIFEELAVTKAGELLIQDEAGTVYLAKEM